jgi:hypothetical protein
LQLLFVGLDHQTDLVITFAFMSHLHTGVGEKSAGTTSDSAKSVKVFIATILILCLSQLTCDQLLLVGASAVPLLLMALALEEESSSGGGSAKEVKAVRSKGALTRQSSHKHLDALVCFLSALSRFTSHLLPLQRMVTLLYGCPLAAAGRSAHNSHRSKQHGAWLPPRVRRPFNVML